MPATDVLTHRDVTSGDGTALQRRKAPAHPLREATRAVLAAFANTARWEGGMWRHAICLGLVIVLAGCRRAATSGSAAVRPGDQVALTIRNGDFLHGQVTRVTPTMMVIDDASRRRLRVHWADVTALKVIDAGREVPAVDGGAAAVAQLTVPAGTVLWLTLIAPVDPAGLRAGDVVEAMLNRSIDAGDLDVISAGSLVVGTVLSPAARSSGRREPAVVEYRFDRVLIGSRVYAVRTMPASWRPWRDASRLRIGQPVGGDFSAGDHPGFVGSVVETSLTAPLSVQVSR